jgi:hypothetical protein
VARLRGLGPAGPARHLHCWWMALAKVRNDLLHFPAPSESEAECSMAIATCYETYLQMYAMLAVFAVLRGDDPTDALGPMPEELWGTF